MAVEWLVVELLWTQIKFLGFFCPSSDNMTHLCVFNHFWPAMQFYSLKEGDMSGFGYTHNTYFVLLELSQRISWQHEKQIFSMYLVLNLDMFANNCRP